MLPTKMQQEKYHYCRTKDKRGFNLKTIVAMKKYNFQCESIHWGLNIHLLQMEGAVESKAEPIGTVQAGKGQVVAGGVCATPRLC